MQRTARPHRRKGRAQCTPSETAQLRSFEIALKAMLSTQRLRRKPSGSLEASLARIAPGLKTKRILQGDAEGPGQAEESRSLETILFAHLRLKSGLPPSSRFFRKPVKHDMEGQVRLPRKRAEWLSPCCPGRQGWARDPETAVPAMLRGRVVCHVHRSGFPACTLAPQLPPLCL